MKQKSFLMLAGATGLSILAAVATTFGTGNAPAFAEAGEKLFPDLQHKTRDLAKLELRDGDFEMTVELQDATFVDAVSGYPIDPEPLRKLVSGMTLAQIAEAKTTDPARHKDLQLAAADAEIGGGREIILLDESGEQLAHMIAGQRDFTLGGVTGGQYARRGDEQAAWLIHGRVDPPNSRSGWFDTRLMEIAASEISAVSLTSAEGQLIALSGEDGTLSIDPLLMEGRAPAENKLGQIVRLIETLDFVDVRALDETDDGANGPRIEATLADDTAITLTALPGPGDENSATWVQIAATGGTEAADALARRVDGFAFSMSSSDTEIFGWDLDDLTEDPAS